eukprot:TRINITY_DN34812_c0_g1_i1.p1 TRINITY_DN34812_c0_g1~~TRINITY_DN34812_c0_g1_i1.p1  ORF type:complete len:913 (+),score=204.97 TRINITY_DN34812_c0_g1_i1:235-2973(+)
MEPEDLAGDLESLDISACKERILQLQAERERRREYTERLQEKLKALNNEHAARKEEAARVKEDLQEEQERNRKKQHDRREREERGGGGPQQLAVAGILASEASRQHSLEKVRHFMEELLQEKAESAVRKNDLGIRTFDETELMVEKPALEQAREGLSVDSVLITYQVPNSEMKYNLSYRVDRNTTAMKLREDACHYWGLSEVEFILKTLDNAKVHDDLTMQSCFRKNEESHLILAQKTPKNTQVMDSEMNSIRPKLGKNSRKPKKTDAVKAESKGPIQDSVFYIGMLNGLPGLYEFLTQRDRNVVGHLPRIKLRNMCVYFFLLVLSILSLIELRPQNTYALRSGLVETLTREWQDANLGRPIPAFENVRSKDELWDWLIYSIPREVFMNHSDLRVYNYMPGYLQVRMQQVAEPSRANCAQDENRLKRLPDNISCYAETYDALSAGKEDLKVVQLYWLGCNQTDDTKSICEDVTYTNRTEYQAPEWTQDLPEPRVWYPGVAGKAGREKNRLPWRFSVGKGLHEVATGTAVEQHDGEWNEFSTGYTAEYSMQFENLTDTMDGFVADMKFLRSVNWIGPRTRHVQVGFNVFNGNYGMWVSVWFNVDMKPTSNLRPSVRVDSYKPTMLSWQNYQAFVLDMYRVVLVFYILTYNMAWEISYERGKKGSGSAWNYFFGVFGILDIGMIVMFTYVIIIRYVNYGSGSFTPTGFLIDIRGDWFSARSISQIYQNQSIVEAGLIAFVTARLILQFRVKRLVFIILSTVASALMRSLMFLCAFVPIICGFVTLGHAIWGDSWEQHSTMMGSYVDTILFVYGISQDANGGSENQTSQRALTMVVYMALFLISHVLLLNAWIAVLVEVYQKTRIASGYWPHTYQWKEYRYISWFFWAPFRFLYIEANRKFLKRTVQVPQEDADG